MTDALDRVAGLVLRETGIELRATQRAALLAAVSRIQPGLDAAEFLRLAADHVTGPAAVARLVEEITIKETTLLRNPGEFQMIDWRCLVNPASEAGPRTARVWSAGCATGEEVYTLALLAAEALGVAPAPVRVLGTDISELALARARAGVYGARAVRALAGPRSRYFRLDGPSATVGEELRSMVEFRQHNLIRDPAPENEPFDLVVCRHVLIYFSADAVERAVTTLQAALRPEGTLILGAADMLAAGPFIRRRGRRAPVVRVSVAKDPPTPVRRPARRLTGAPAIEADEWCTRGLRQLDAGDPGEAVESLRRALYLDPTLSLAAFALGNAYEAVGDREAARRSYARALLSLDRGGGHRAPLAVTAADVALACEHRLKALAT